MRISELIKDLEKFKSIHGDILVTTMEEGMGGYGINLCDGLSAHTETIGGYYVQDGGEDGMVEDTTIKKLFPEWDGEHESLEDIEEIQVAIISSGDRIFST